MNYLAVNIGGTTCSVGLLRPEGAILKSEAFPSGEATATLERLLSFAKDFADNETAAVGISCGGPLDEKNGLILSPPNLPGWDTVPVSERFHDATQLPCYLMNDANAGVLAEWYWGTHCQCPSLIFLTCGTGMGAGMMLNGRLYEGANGFAGEIGHVRLTPQGPIGYHKAGSVEGWCSGNGFLQYAGCTVKEAAQALRNGQVRYRQPVRTFARRLGQTLALLIDTVNPEKIVLGGIFLRMEDELRPEMETVLRTECLPEALAACCIAKAACGENIGLHAALAVARYRSGADPLDRLVTRYPELAVCSQELRSMIGLIGDTLAAGNKLLIYGSAAAAEPIAAGLPVIVLQGRDAFPPAFAHGVGASHMNAHKLHIEGDKHDVFLGVSASGNTETVLAAARTAQAMGMKVMGMTGREGGALATICDICLKAPASETFVAQELLLPVYHALCMALENRCKKSWLRGE